MFSYTNFRQREAQALNNLIRLRDNLKVVKANPVYEGTEYAANIKSVMRMDIKMARYWRERNKVVLP